MSADELQPSVRRRGSSPTVKEGSTAPTTINHRNSTEPSLTVGLLPRGALRVRSRIYIFLAFHSANRFSKSAVLALASLPRTKAFSPAAMASSVLP